MKPLVIYHAPCRDGFCAAWCVWRANPGAEFFPTAYGAPTPEVKGKDVILVDFSYSLSEMERIASEAKTLLVLDHHKTAQAALSSFKAANATVIFDMERSGAGLAWDHYFPKSPRPWIVDYVEDRDLWRHALPKGPAVNSFLSTLRYDFETWYVASRRELEEIKELGEVVEDKIRAYVIETAKNVRKIEFEGFNVPIVNAPPTDISELLNFLASGEVFVIGWFQRADGMFSYSLRSKGDFDVSEIAKRHGGGGHKNAAGFLSKDLLL